MMIDPMSRKPVYEQIVDQLEQMVLSGAIRPGDQLPSVRSLSLELSLNPNTIQKAYTDLDTRGILYAVPGRGCFVSANAPAILSEERRRELGTLERLARSLAEAGIPEEELIERVRRGYRAVSSGTGGSAAGSAGAAGAGGVEAAVSPVGAAHTAGAIPSGGEAAPYRVGTIPAVTADQAVFLQDTGGATAETAVSPVGEAGTGTALSGSAEFRAAGGISSGSAGFGAAGGISSGSAGFGAAGGISSGSAESGAAGGISAADEAVPYRATAIPAAETGAVFPRGETTPCRASGNPVGTAAPEHPAASVSSKEPPSRMAGAASSPVDAAHPAASAGHGSPSPAPFPPDSPPSSPPISPRDPGDPAAKPLDPHGRAFRIPKEESL